MPSLRTIRLIAFPAVVLLTGMGVAQAIATFQVYASNRELWERMVAVAAAGFLPVPNEHAMLTLLRRPRFSWTRICVWKAPSPRRITASMGWRAAELGAEGWIRRVKPQNNGR